LPLGPAWSKGRPDLPMRLSIMSRRHCTAYCGKTNPTWQVGNGQGGNWSGRTWRELAPRDDHRAGPATRAGLARSARNPARSQLVASEFGVGTSLMPSKALISTSRYRRWPPGVRMLLIRPEAAHRVTVLGSTLKSAATSPGVSRRSLCPSIRFSLLLASAPHI
jgi:hypothetical protein